jgi:hypothetical protein
VQAIEDANRAVSEETVDAFIAAGRLGRPGR